MVKFNFKKIDRLNTPYPLISLGKFLDKKTCTKLCKEIDNFKKYDDLVMNGRFRVNKGSSHFEKQLKQSPHLRNLYYQLNSFQTFKKIKNYLIYKNKNKNDLFYPTIKSPLYSKIKFGRQSFKLFDHLRETRFISSFFRQTLNLDMDFSKSKKGYFRVAHRDRDTRVISFLIYLNTFKKKDGGELEVFDTNKNFFEQKKYPRFPDKKVVKKTMGFTPKAGHLIAFMSTPNSYHGVSKFKSSSRDRIFIYGSYSMDRKVTWKINDKQSKKLYSKHI